MMFLSLFSEVFAASPTEFSFSATAAMPAAAPMPNATTAAPALAIPIAAEPRLFSCVPTEDRPLLTLSPSNFSVNVVDSPIVLEVEFRFWPRFYLFEFPDRVD